MLVFVTNIFIKIFRSNSHNISIPDSTKDTYNEWFKIVNGTKKY